MTRERRLAVKMWSEIAEKIRSLGYVNIKQEKLLFCVNNNLTWSYQCWFCQYMKPCDNCRLSKIGGSCVTHHSLYQSSIYGDTCEVRASAAEMIAKIFNGDDVSENAVRNIVFRRRAV